MEKWGLGFLGIGVLLVIAGFALDPTVPTEGVPRLAVNVPERVVNFQKLAIKSQLTIAGSGAAIVGTILYAVAQLIKTWEHAALRSPTLVAGRTGQMGQAMTGDPFPPPGYHGMFKIGRTEIWTNKDGRAWVAGREFESVDAATAWVTGSR